ncbi:hypothetical protein [Sphingomonas bacterium]|uniref:hypothetical protein n=1 Tax=Sphingomonas bacterium TaxID=1895847 RepID=UPI001575B137|nr:hypothetical protein [Sphingomonas bacterium]
MHLRKDRSLDELAEVGNVAQFVSFEPGRAGPEQAYLRIRGLQPNQRFDEPVQALAHLLSRSSDRSVNVRSYTPESPRSREFVYGLTDLDAIVTTVNRLSAEGLHTIANETVDVADGGVSGVAQGGVLEFAPDDTPRCVEKPGVASLPLDLGMRLLETVYGFAPDLGPSGGRVEFSIHPRPRGWRQTHTLLWEHEDDDGPSAIPSLGWPNRFSRHLGDKAYGLLMTHLAGMPVPRTTVVARRVAPFTFGQDTGSRETWIRTCPTEQQPGLFTTHRGWLDPFGLMADEDPDGNMIASVLAQAGVQARHSGASLVDVNGRAVIEGVAGSGDLFMLGRRSPEDLPIQVIEDVRAAMDRLAETFGPVRTEWVHDGTAAWIVQTHQGATQSSSQILVPGERERWVGFPVSLGIEELRALLHGIDADAGVQLLGEVGMTSHIADLVRKAGVPARVVPT